MTYTCYLLNVTQWKCQREKNPQMTLKKILDYGCISHPVRGVVAWHAIITITGKWLHRSNKYTWWILQEPRTIVASCIVAPCMWDTSSWSSSTWKNLTKSTPYQMMTWRREKQDIDDPFIQLVNRNKSVSAPKMIKTYNILSPFHNNIVDEYTQFENLYYQAMPHWLVHLRKRKLFWYPRRTWNILDTLQDNQQHDHIGLILGLRPANERRRYFVKASLIGWAQS